MWELITRKIKKNSHLRSEGWARLKKVRNKEGRDGTTKEVRSENHGGKDNLQKYTYTPFARPREFCRTSSAATNGQNPTSSRAVTFALNLRKCVAVARFLPPPLPVFSAGVSPYTNPSRRFSRKSTPAARWMKIHGRLEKLTSFRAAAGNGAGKTKMYGALRLAKNNAFHARRLKNLRVC